MTAGQTVVVMGATGQLGSAAVLIALARGAGRVVAVAVAVTPKCWSGWRRSSQRVLPVPLTDTRVGTAAAIAAAGGEVDAVVDTLGALPSNAPTLAGYDSLRPGGTLVLVGGVRQDLPLPYPDLMHRRLPVRLLDGHTRHRPRRLGRWSATAWSTST